MHANFLYRISISAAVGGGGNFWRITNMSKIIYNYLCPAKCVHWHSFLQEPLNFGQSPTFLFFSDPSLASEFLFVSLMQLDAQILLVP